MSDSSDFATAEQAREDAGAANDTAKLIAKYDAAVLAANVGPKGATGPTGPTGPTGV